MRCSPRQSKIEKFSYELKSFSLRDSFSWELHQILHFPLDQKNPAWYLCVKRTQLSWSLFFTSPGAYRKCLKSIQEASEAWGISCQLGFLQTCMDWKQIEERRRGPANTPLSRWQLESMKLRGVSDSPGPHSKTAADGRSGLLPAFFKKIILSRFNVHILFKKYIHMFLTCGTYSIKISYWINDAH